jgi:hypothetical protein
VAETAARLTEACRHLRVSEAAADARARKLLGRPTAEICGQAVASWQRRVSELHASVMALGKPDPNNRQQMEAFSAYQIALLASASDLCRDVGEKIAGRPVEVVWCSSWYQLLSRGSTDHAGPPEEIWRTLDGSPFEGIAAKQSTRDEALREILGRRFAKDWDQLQITADMEGIGFVCGVWTPQGDLDRRVTTAMPKLNCNGRVGEFAAMPSGPPRSSQHINIDVTVKFAETGEPRGWQKIEVETAEGHL